MVPRRGHLPGPRQDVRRLRRRRHRRLPRTDLEARLPAGPRRHRAVAPAVLPVAAPGRRLRHRVYRDIHPSYGTLRDFKTLLREAHERGLRRDHRARHEPHLGPAPVVPAGPAVARPDPRTATSTCGATRRTDTPRPGSSSRTSSTPTGPGTAWPARTSGTGSTRTSRTSTSTTPRSVGPCSASSTSGSRWGSTACASTRCRICTNARERTARTCRRRTSSSRSCARHIDDRFRNRMLLAEANQWPEDAVAYFGEGDDVPHGVPLPGHAADVHGDPHGGPVPDHRHPRADPADPRGLPSGRCSCAITTS